MKFIILLLALISCQISAQNSLKFDKRNVQCEDKWVAFQMEKDSTYLFGFIYIDPSAGLTFHNEGSFKIDSKGVFIPTKVEKDTRIIARLEPSRIGLALIPEAKFKELEIVKVPEWLKNYKQDENSVAHLYHWGFLYNAWDECEKALTYLEKAQKIDPNFNGLNVELAYSYNALGQYQKAVDLLSDSIKDHPEDCYFRKELIYAHANLLQLAKAEEIFEEGLKVCTDNEMKCEMALNIAYQYFLKKDKSNFLIWSKKSKQLAPKYIKNLNAMEAELN